MAKFLCGVYVGASLIFIWGMFIELKRMGDIINGYQR